MCHLKLECTLPTSFINITRIKVECEFLESTVLLLFILSNHLNQSHARLFDRVWLSTRAHSGECRLVHTRVNVDSCTHG